MNQNTSQEIKTIEHLKWLFPNLEVSEGFGHNINGAPLYGIFYNGIVFHTDLEKFNQCGLEIDHIKQNIESHGVICVVFERRENKK